MTKPKQCKQIKCQECGNYKYCPEHTEYENSLDAAMKNYDISRAREIVREWLGI